MIHCSLCEYVLKKDDKCRFEIFLDLICSLHGRTVHSCVSVSAWLLNVCCVSVSVYVCVPGIMWHLQNWIPSHTTLHKSLSVFLCLHRNWTLFVLVLVSTYQGERTKKSQPFLSFNYHCPDSKESILAQRNGAKICLWVKYFHAGPTSVIRLSAVTQHWLRQQVRVFREKRETKRRWDYKIFIMPHWLLSC